MKTKLIVLILLSLLLPIVSAQTLIDSENFDNYTIYQTGFNVFDSRDLFINQSAGKWDCMINSRRPNCIYSVGTPTSSMIANYSIESWGYPETNNFLSLWALAGDYTNYRTVSLWWDHTNFTFPNQGNMTYTFRIRYRDWMVSYVPNPYTVYNYGGFDFRNARNAGSYPTLSFISGKNNAWTDVENVSRNFLAENTNSILMTAQWIAEPQCKITDGRIHDIVYQYRYNPTTALYDAIVYDNGGLCANVSCAAIISLPDIRDGWEIKVGSRYKMDIDDLKVYLGTKQPNTPESYEVGENLGFCPITSCLFFDDFNLYSSNYTANFSIAHPTAPNDNGWTYAEGLVNIINDDLYLNSSVWGTQGRNADMSHLLMSHSEYESIASIIQFRLNGSAPTPATMENEYVSYRFNTYCDNGITSSSIPVYFVRNDDWTYSENATAINVYVSENGLRLLGTLTLKNTQSFYIKEQYDYRTSNIKINIIRDIDAQDFGNDDFMFLSPMMQSCRVASFTIQRGDIQNPEDHFVGIDKVYFYGIPSINGETIFQYVNETAFNDSIVKTDIGEEIQNGITSLGIRTTASKIFLWALLTVITIIGVAKSALPDNGKIFGLMVSQFALTIAMFYFQLLPAALFAVIMFIYAIASALALYTIFGNKQGA
jgi:hypothetical protein